ncbi:aldo/keto reductase [Brevibacterium sp. 50QC2O2]|jgi:L-glyceraldehyde 3-phosphate reductase|uniref:aldo/keto reductase n=1 Tax=Brevibacterium TaxID=1696 RepID=UPI00211CB17B|nr:MULTISPECIES: aldo/keto reductase [unclassified Brevibacterium]MCQ9384811.1 aldo/keto reductase [Brevibacterium sp. 68QC2CO]MCQ9387574.1 aldo/keto reductase [Brevibacterium sp. 50QC2O2]
MSYQPAADRYAHIPVRRSGRSGLQLPGLSLGLWQRFGDDRSIQTQREIVLAAFDRGVFHLDLANNYGPPAGAAEANLGRILKQDLAAHRDELVISTKAGWTMGPGPFGIGGSRKYLVSSLDRSLERMGLDAVDIFYHHRPDPDTPLEETAAALDHIVRSGRAHYVGISSYSPQDSRTMAGLLRGLGTPLTIHQPSYSMFNRWIEAEGLVDAAADEGFGIIGFSPLAQGMLTDKYIGGIPDGARAAQGGTLNPDWLTDEVRARLQGLHDIAAGRGQSLAQLALSWALRDPRVTSLVAGASSVAQLEENLDALDHLDFTEAELREIDRFAVDCGIDNWADARNGSPVTFR